MRRQQHIGAQREGSEERHQPAFLGGFDVTGQQDGGRGRDDAQHAAAGVGARRAGTRGLFARVQPFETDTAPLPLLPASAGVMTGRGEHHRMRRRQRGGHPVHRPLAQQRQGAAGMVGVAVRHHHRLQTGDATGPQIGREHPRPGVVVIAVGRAGVVEQSPLGGLDQHGHALTDIQRGEPQLIRARRGHRTEQQRQKPCACPGPAGYRPR
ncbi:MAG: hypothetical protein NTV19_00940, partial [Burkholderiales bacterium]|nr:hypothetical protein [Burkholderiales bacterium]